MTRTITKSKLGQYFTNNEELQKKVFDFILNDPIDILEPSIGKGHLVSYVLLQKPHIVFDMYEIDPTIPVLENIPREKVVYGDFLKESIPKKYNTIIGNPPYIRTKKANTYIDFIEKCYRLLEDDGELIFIVPSDFFKLTSSSKLLEKMMDHGTFTHIYHPHNENLFENACIDILIFRYCKNASLEKNVLYNDTPLHLINNSGIITFSETAANMNDTGMIKDYFDVYVGIVSGKEEVYKNNSLGNIEVFNGEGKLEKYIYIESFPSNDENINTYLLEHKSALMNRQIRNFNENNWFEWGAPRNIHVMREKMTSECIYIYNLTRKTNVAFVGCVNYFGGNLLMLIPKKRCDINKVVDYLNSHAFKSNYMFSGRFKIGHRQIEHSNIPIEFLGEI